MDPRNPGYNSAQIALHWTIAALVVFQLLFGDSMTIYVRSVADGRQLSHIDQTMSSAHYWVGLAILFLTFIRLAIRFICGAPQASTSAPKWMAVASRTTHILFYFLLIATPVSGLFAFYTWDWMGDIHALAKPIFIVLIGLHAIAALYHHFVFKDATLRNMLMPPARAVDR